MKSLLDQDPAHLHVSIEAPATYQSKNDPPPLDVLVEAPDSYQSKNDQEMGSNATSSSGDLLIKKKYFHISPHLSLIRKVRDYTYLFVMRYWKEIIGQC